MWRPLQLGCAIVFGACATVRSARATSDSCEAHRGPGVIIDHCHNYDYYDRSLDLGLRHAAHGLAVVRTRLVALGRIADLPILVRLPAFAEPARIERREECERYPNDMDPPESLGACYVVVPPARDYATLRTLVAVLSVLRPSEMRAATDLGALAREAHTDGRGFVASLPDELKVSAPNGRYAVRGSWLDGQLDLDVVAGRQVLGRLARTRGDLATYPMWSPSSRRLVVSTTRQVRVHDLRTGGAWRFDFARHLPPRQEVHGLVAALDTTESRLVVYAHANPGWCGGWIMDLATGRVRDSYGACVRPGWAAVLEDAAAASSLGRPPAGADVLAAAQRELDAVAATLDDAPE